MLILGLESSCDETAAALVRDGRDVLASVIASQTEVHAPFGGVVPEVAAREHLRVIDGLVRRVFAEAGVGPSAIDAIGVTQGPGLIGALLVGVAYGKGLAQALGKPLVPVDHVHAHVHGALLGVSAPDTEVFPTLALVVSGGHTNLYRMPAPTVFELLGSTADDACGECFDKVAKMMGFGYPGGPEIESRAAPGSAGRVAMPRMISRRSRLEFSYSGLKTHMVNLLRTEPRPIPDDRLADLCAAFQEEALGQLVRKIAEAARQHTDIRSILIAGGVAANRRFRTLLTAEVRLPCHFPPLNYCSDNAAMIAAYAARIIAAGPGSGRDFTSHDWDAYSRYDYAAHAPDAAGI